MTREHSVSGSALQPWMVEVPIKRQCELFSALRGPDFQGSREVKRLVRWLRSLAVHSVPEGHYTTVEGELPPPKEVAKDAEWLSCHYVLHLAEGLAVIVTYHPDPSVRRCARTYVQAMARPFRALWKATRR